RFNQITDGLSNTLMVGEKHVRPADLGRVYLDASTYNGDNPASWCRGAGWWLNQSLARDVNDYGWKFGGPHTAVCLFAMCDGAVRAIPNTISEDVLALPATRDAGPPIRDY